MQLLNEDKVAAFVAKRKPFLWEVLMQSVCARSRAFEPKRKRGFAGFLAGGSA